MFVCIGFSPARTRSSTAKCGKRSVKALYQFGSWHGSVCQDVIKFKDGPMEFTYLALIEHSQHFFIRGAIWQGILGLAYASLARVRAAYVGLCCVYRTRRALD